jgi:cytochrome c5
LLVAVGLIYLFVFSMAEDGFGKNMERVNEQQKSEIATRIKPVVTLDDIMGGKEAQQPVAVAAKTPRELFEGACQACHLTGVAGAPKLGDKAAWEPRFANGIDALLNTAKTGKGAMPPNGGSAYSEEEIRSIIEFMLSQAGLIEAPAVATESTAPAAEAQTTESAATAGTSPASDNGDADAGEDVYRTVCFACHDTGAAGAPKKGDVAAWAPRIDQGFDALLHSALNGKGAMPPKGGATNLAGSDIANAIAFIVENSK